MAIYMYVFGTFCNNEIGVSRVSGSICNKCNCHLFKEIVSRSTNDNTVLLCKNESTPSACVLSVV